MSFFLFVMTSMIALATPPRFRHALLAMGVLTVAVGMAWLYLPGYWGGDAYYRLTALALLPLAVGGGIFLGALGRSILDGAPFREAAPVASRILRVFILVALVIGGGFAYLSGLFAVSQNEIQQKIRFDRADLNLVFRQAIAEKKVPKPDGKGFQVFGAGCGMSPGRFYRIRYHDETDDTIDYFGMASLGDWQLKSYGPSRSEIVLPRLTHPY